MMPALVRARGAGMERSESGQKLVRINYLVRAIAFGYCFAAFGVHLWRIDASTWDWAALTMQFLVYPHILYLRARGAERPAQTAIENLFMNSALFGIWCAHLGFPHWITFTLLGGTTLNAAVNRGAQGLFWSLSWAIAGAALWISVAGFHYRPETSDLVTAFCFFGGLAYTNAMGYVAYLQNRRLSAARNRMLLGAKVLEGMGEGLMITDAAGTIVEVNRAFTEITGFPREEVLGQHERITRRAMQPPEYYDALWETVRREGYWSGATWSTRRDGDLYREWRSVRAIGRRDAPSHHVSIISVAEAGRGQAEDASG
jgi:PAS domain S-box-containing protein